MISTDDKDIAAATFGEGIGDVPFDAYYGHFFAAGCQGDWGTSGWDGTARANECEPSEVEPWKVVPVIETPDVIVMVDGNETVAEKFEEWKLEYCCNENHCSGGERAGGRWWTAVVAAVAGGAAVAWF